MMRIMTWNIENGGVINRDYPKLQNIRNILNEIEEVNPDILVIQEYQSAYRRELVTEGLEKLSYVCTAWGEDTQYTLRNRVLIASKLPFQEREHCPGTIRRYFQKDWKKICIPERNLTVLGVHIPIAESKRMDGTPIDQYKDKKDFVDALLHEFVRSQKEECGIIILGDFNLHTGDCYCKEHLSKFYELLSEVTTEDATHGDKKFDYIFVNAFLEGKIDKAATNKPHFTRFSDHAYLYVDIDD